MDQTIQEGETLVLFEDAKPKLLITLKSGNTYQNKYGAFHHASLIGALYGEKIMSKNNQGYIHLIKPTPYLITETVPHKTQILFLMDISLILMKLNIKPADKVIESGTGSGSLSSSLSQCVGKTGRLFTYEFNEDRAKNGKELLNKLNFTQSTCFWRDVYANGFHAIDDDNDFNKGQEVSVFFQIFLIFKNQFPADDSIDAVFLDLPQPWFAITHAKRVLKINKKICCFSPCIEQVQKTVESLRNEGFVNVETVECLKRYIIEPFYFEIRQFEKRLKTEQQIFEPKPEKKVCVEEQKKKIFYSSGVTKSYGHTGFLTFATLSIK